MVKSKPSHPPEGNELKIPTDRNKVQAFKPKKYIGNKPRNKPSLEPKTKTDFQVQCTDLKGYTVDLGPISSDKFSRTMKELERYLGESFQIQMGFSFPFLRANDLRASLLNIRAHIFLLFCT